MADFDWASAISSLIGGGLDLRNALNHSDTENARTAAQYADPFMQEREGYQKQLHGLMTDPGSFKQDPGYQFALDQGLDSVARKGNSMFGTTRSGNTALELEKFGSGYASQAYDKRIQELMQLSGANGGNPGEAGKIIAGGYNDANKTVAGATSGLTDGIARLLGSLPGGIGGAMAGVFKQIFGLTGGTIDETHDQGTGSINPGDGGTPGPDGYGGITIDDLIRAGLSPDQARDFFGGGPPADPGPSDTYNPGPDDGG